MRQLLQKFRSRKGLALVTVLWVVMLMTVLVSVTSQSALLDTHISHVNVERQRCRWACRAGIETAISLLVADDPGYDCLSDEWAPDSDSLEDLELAGCTVEITVTDTSSKLNLNRVGRKQLLYLPDMTEEIADCILDWRDEDDQVREFGAEDGYYMNQSIRYRPQNRGFKTTREVLRVRGVDEGLFYGDPELGTISKDNKGWQNYLTHHSLELNVDVSGNRKIDINTAGQNQLQQTLTLSAGQAKWITANRMFRKFSDLMKETSGSTRNNNRPANQNRETDQNREGDQNSKGNQNEAQAVAPDLETALRIIDNATLNNRRFYSGRVNINTAGVIVLTAILEGDRELAENIIAYRNGLTGGFTSMADLQQIEGVTLDKLKKLVDLTSVRSSVYEIDCVAHSDATDLKFYVKAIVNRQRNEGRILYWQEGISN